MLAATVLAGFYTVFHITVCATEKNKCQLGGVKKTGWRGQTTRLGVKKTRWGSQSKVGGSTKIGCPLNLDRFLSSESPVSPP